MKASVLIGFIAFIAMTGIASKACLAEATWLANYPDRCERCVDDGKVISCATCTFNTRNPEFDSDRRYEFLNHVQRLEYANCPEQIVMNDNGRLVCVTKLSNMRFQQCLTEKLYKNARSDLVPYMCKQWAGRMSPYR